MIVMLLTEQHSTFLSLKGGCSGLSEFTLVKMPHCWKSHALAQLSSECRSTMKILAFLFFALTKLYLNQQQMITRAFKQLILHLTLSSQY